MLNVLPMDNPMATTQCPDRDQLLCYLLGKLPDDTSEQIAAHLDECPTCEATAETLDQVSDTLVSQLNRPLVPSRFDNEPQYKEALQRVLALAGPESVTVGESVRTVGDVSPDLGQLGEYKLLEKLGEGGMGAVYKARHTKLDRLVALKVLPKARMQDPHAVSRFEREMKAVGRLNHLHIVQAHDAREIDSTHFLAMEYVEGLDLSKLITATGALRVADACELMRQAAVGLQHAHEQGLVHRDIKPSNLMLNRQGTVKILDLGLALLGVNQPNHPEMTAAGTAMGTADYVSPEQVTDSHSVDIRSDIYSLGCTLYKLLSGQAPFVGPQYKNDVTKMMAHVDKVPPPISLLRTDLPPGLAKVIERMMAKKPEDRFATPGEVATALGPFVADCDLGRLLNEANGTLGLPTVETSRSASTGKLSGSAEIDTGASQSPVAPVRHATAVLETSRKSQRAGKPLAAAGPAFSARWPMIGTAIALGLAGIILLGVVLLRVKTPAGTIVIEADQLEIAGAVVEVDGQQRVTIDPGQGQEKVTVAADEQEHVLKVTKGGFETYTKKFTVKAGKEQTITVRLEPVASASPQPKEHGGEGPPKTAVAKSTPPAPREEAPAMTPATPAQPPSKTATVARSEPPRAEHKGDVTADAAWTPGPLYNVLPGFIPRPAKLPGIRRWQVISVAPREPITSIDWSTSGLVAIASGRGMPRVYDAATLDLKFTLYAVQDGGVYRLAWSPNGARLAIGSEDPGNCRPRLQIWKVDGTLERMLEVDFNPHAKFSWSPDGQRIACGAGPQVRVVNLDGTPGPVFKGHEDHVTAVAWSPDGKQLVSSSVDKTVRVWNVDGTLGPVLKGHGLNVNDVDWSPDGKWIVSAGEDIIRLWKPDGSPGPVISKGNASRVEWHPDSVRFVVSSMNTAYTNVYNINGNERTPLRDSPGGCVTWSTDGKQIVVGDGFGNILVWDDKGRCLPSLTGGSWYPMMVAWSSTGLLASRTGDGTLTFWTGDGQLVRTVKDTAGIGRDMQWSPDGQVLLSGGSPNMQLWNADGTRGKTVGSEGDYVAWSPDGKQFAALTSSEIRIYDANTEERKSWNHGGLHYEVGRPGPEGYRLNWSADGRWLAHGAVNYPAGNESFATRLWNVDGTPGPSAKDLGLVLALHPKEPLLATLYPNLRLWRIGATQESTDTGKRPDQPASSDSWQDAAEASLSLVWSQEVSPTATYLSRTGSWSPDGEWLALETVWHWFGDCVRLCGRSGRRGLSFKGLGDAQSLSWSPDSRQLAMGLADERVAVSDAKTGQAVWIGVHLPGGEAAVFSGAGRLLPGQESKMDVLDKHLAYVVEHPDGRMEVVKPSQFPTRAAELARQAPVPEWAEPVPTLPDGSIDLMPLVEIKADAKPETDWTRDGKSLIASAGKPLPIPISLSGDYDLVVQAETREKVEGLSLLLQADGHPFEAVLCAGGHISGLQMIGGQDVGQNETVLRESLLGQGQKFQLTCQVRRKQIRVLLDDRAIVQWNGEFEQLSADRVWGTFAGDGLLGILAHAPYRIHELKLIPRSDAAKQSVNTIGDRAVAEKLREMGANLGIRQAGQESNGLSRVVEVHFNTPLSDADMPAVGVLLATLDQLRTVLLHFGDVTDDGLKHLPHLHGILTLSLSDTLVRNPLAVLTIDRDSLANLWLTNTPLDDEAFNEIGKCQSISHLQLDRTRLTAARLLRLNALSKLNNLNISDNPLELSEEVIRQLVKFESLLILGASKIPATEERLMRLAEIKQLQSLHLSDTQTTDRVLAQLQTLPNLGELVIKNTPATEAGVKALKAALPNCRVDWSQAKQP